MSLQVSNLKHNNALVELSIDEQVGIIGGVYYDYASAPEKYYAADLGKYSKGEASISSNGNIVSFTYPNEINRVVVDSFEVIDNQIKWGSNGKTIDGIAFKSLA